MRVNFVEIENYLVKIGWSMRLVVFNITVFRVYIRPCRRLGVKIEINCIYKYKIEYLARMLYA